MGNADNPPSLPCPKPNLSDVNNAITVERDNSYPPRWIAKERDMHITLLPRLENKPLPPLGDVDDDDGLLLLIVLLV